VERPEPGDSDRRASDPTLAADVSALDRTFASWVRTGLALAALGFVILRLGYYLNELAAAGGVELPAQQRLTNPVGLLHTLAGGVMIVLAGLWHRRSVHARRAGDTDPRILARPVVLALTVGSLIGGVGLAVDLVLATAK
jgi:putative membrane protein